MAAHFTNKIKPPKSHSSIESNLVKLCRQMKKYFNDMVLAGAPSPVVCGIKFDGSFMETFVLHMPSPKVYCVYKLAGVDAYHGLEQFNLIPALISHLLQAKNMILKVIDDVEAAILTVNENLRKLECSSPSSWLSYDYCVFMRERKRTTE